MTILLDDRNQAGVRTPYIEVSNIKKGVNQGGGGDGGGAA